MEFSFLFTILFTFSFWGARTAAPDGTAENQENEIAASNGTRPPLNFIAILRDAGITIDTSSPYTVSDQLYAGVFLKPSKLASSLSISPHLIYLFIYLEHFFTSYIN